MLVRLAKGRIVSKGLEVSHETRRRKRPAISWLGDGMSGCMTHGAQCDEYERILFNPTNGWSLCGPVATATVDIGRKL